MGISGVTSGSGREEDVGKLDDSSDCNILTLTC